MASRTREKLIEVARQLFLRKGVENTTISDIANASDKGRRTIYTYFKSKKEIYGAVIEQESELMVKALRDISESDATATDKLQRFFEKRFSETKFSATPHCGIRSLLSFDFRQSDLIRKKAYEKEESILIHILNEGISNGEFDEARCQLMRDFLYRLLHAIDTLSAHDDYTPIETSNRHAFITFLTRGVQK